MTRVLIPTTPVLERSVLKLRAGELPAMLCGEDVHFFGYARAALLAALELLGMGRGDNVLVPSLICDVVILPFDHLGIEVRFYPVEDGLNPDFRVAAQLVDQKTRAFLGVNYFGFPQDFAAAREFCSQHHLWFIEDNAHGLLSAIEGQAVGSSGDISIVSFRKTIPVPDGAAMIVNNPSLRGQGTQSDVQRRATRLWPSARVAAFAARNVVRNIEISLGVSVLSPVKSRRAPSSRAARASYNGRIGHQGLGSDMFAWSSISEAIARHLDWQRVVTNHRVAWQTWMEHLERAGRHPTPIFPRLPQGAVPYALPVLVKDRAQWLAKMEEAGVDCFAWPDLPAASTELRFAGCLAAIPLHTVPARENARFLDHASG